MVIFFLKVYSVFLYKFFSNLSKKGFQLNNDDKTSNLPLKLMLTSKCDDPKTQKDFLKQTPSFTLMFSYKPVPLMKNSVDIQIGDNIQIILRDTGASLATKADLFDIKIQKKPHINLLHFNNSLNLLFISKHSLDRNKLENNFIKIGQGYRYVDNVIFEINPKNQQGNLLKKTFKYSLVLLYLSIFLLMLS